MLLLWNIKSFIRKSPLYFCLFACILVITTVGTLYVYNFMQSITEKQLQRDQASRSYTVAGRREDLEQKMKQLLESHAGQIVRLSPFLMQGKTKVLSIYYGDMGGVQLVHFGRYFTREEEKEGAKKIIISKDDPGDALGETLQLNGADYEAIGRNGVSSYRLIPYHSIANKHDFSGLELVAAERYTEKQQAVFMKNLQELFAGAEITAPAPADEKAEKTFALQEMMIFALFLLGFFNLSFLFAAILKKRHKMLAVYRVCGGSVGKTAAAVVSELAALASVLFIVSALLFRYVFLFSLEKWDSFFIHSLQGQDYFLLYLCCLATMVLIFAPTVYKALREAIVKMLF